MASGKEDSLGLHSKESWEPHSVTAMEGQKVADSGLYLENSLELGSESLWAPEKIPGSGLHLECCLARQRVLPKEYRKVSKMAATRVSMAGKRGLRTALTMEKTNASWTASKKDL